VRRRKRDVAVGSGGESARGEIVVERGFEERERERHRIQRERKEQDEGLSDGRERIKAILLIFFLANLFPYILTLMFKIVFNVKLISVIGS